MGSSGVNFFAKNFMEKFHLFLMLAAIVTFRDRCRTPEIFKTKPLVSTVNGFHLLFIAVGARVTS